MNTYEMRRLRRKAMEQPIEIRDYLFDERFQATTKNFSIDDNQQIEGVFFETGHMISAGRDIQIVFRPSKTSLFEKMAYNGFAKVVWCIERESQVSGTLYRVGAQCVNNECSFCKNSIRDADIYYWCGEICLCSDCSKHVQKMTKVQIKHNFERFMLGNFI